MSRIADRQGLEPNIRHGLAENDLDGLEDDLRLAEARLHAEVERGNRELVKKFEKVEAVVEAQKRIQWSLVIALVGVLATLVASLALR
jgi:hypothetical protein